MRSSSLVAILLCVATMATANPHNFFGEQSYNSGSLSKRQGVLTCPKMLNCFGRGETCSTNGFCSNCLDNFSTCTSAAGTNNVAICACYNSAVACLVNVTNDQNSGESCWGNIATLQDSCVTQFQRLGASCACPNTTVPQNPQTKLKTCRSTDFCKIPNGQNFGYCAERKEIGTCKTTITDQCGDPENEPFAYDYECNSATTQCRLVPASKNNGDMCIGSAECKSNNCSLGICTGSTTTCGSDDQCAYGYWCNAGQCAPEFTIGGACTYSAGRPVCGVGRLCSGSNICIQAFSSQTGEACRESPECVVGAYCKAGVCTAVPATPVTCQTDGNCASVEAASTCECDSTTGDLSCSLPGYMEIPMGDCQVHVQTYFGCVRRYSCKVGLSDLIADPQTCAMQYCPSETKCLLQCVSSTGSFSRLSGLGCFDIPSDWTCPAVPTDATTTGESTTDSKSSDASSIIASLALLIAVIAALLF